ncbi:EAL domain-containing protein [Candidatus Stoquefichus massiliensis]|uniref:EAL domain-containing protein n=1 Tax=Candidatus Stoquefichus massiliensis TaxID=1470350 RepID=UPI000677B496|nr:EAL domain-containing protein [Candidatus Stoquefichus massiliensis]
MKRIFKKIITIILTLIFIFLCFPQKLYALEKINVGFIDYKGFIEKDISGAYSGYAVDYLNEISKYTQWEYHYVFDTWDRCLEKLKTGDIDILCSAQYTPERDQYFDYSSLPIGNEYTIIYTNLDTPIYFNDYSAMNNKVIGLLEDSYQNQSLKKYADEKHFQYQEKYYKNEEDIINALHKNEVDMIAVGSLPLHDNVKVVAKFDPQHFYITVKEGNTQLLDRINQSLKTIQESSPYFEMDLFNRYYSNSAYSTQPLLTREEVEYIQKQKTIPVGMLADSFPFAYKDNNKQDGILIKILNKISEKTGLTFEYQSMYSNAESQAFMKEDSSRLFCGAFKHSKEVISGKYWSSQSILDVDQVIVSKKNSYIENFNDATIALTFSLEIIGKELLRDYPDAKIIYYPTISECLDDVVHGDADLTVYNTYTTNYLIQKPEYENQLSVHSISLNPISICITANNEIDEYLVSIINKAIESFSKVEKDKIIYNYTIGFRYQYSLLDNLYLYRYSIILGIIVLIFAGILLYILNKRHMQYLMNKKESDILRRKVEVDTLTGLYNPEIFFDKVKNVLETSQDDFFILYIDVNRFKIVNELYGMQSGDQLLSYIGKQLQELSHKYPNVITCHFNADKFFIFAPHLYCEDICQTDILKDYHIEIELSLRFGLYHITDLTIPVNLMCDRAALASQDVRGNYFNKMGIYDDQKRLKILQEQEIVDNIQDAIMNNQLFIMIQPKYDIMNEKVIGGESLVRWKHPIKGFISPADFIPILENNGYIIHLDYFVWEKTCQFLHALKQRGLNISISVNVSRLNFYRPHLIELLEELLQKYELEPHNLQLEITESIYSEDTKFIYSIARELQKHGFIILMDDFGSGYSSLNMLKDAPVDIIKLDMAFLSNKEDTSRSHVIIEGVVNLASSLHLPVIVEGVETADQVSFLKSICVQYIQGYYFSKPLLEHEFKKLYIKYQK